MFMQSLKSTLMLSTWLRSLMRKERTGRFGGMCFAWCNCLETTKKKLFQSIAWYSNTHQEQHRNQGWDEYNVCVVFDAKISISSPETAGSFALLKSTVPEDSTIARKLREAGAILLGKTNLSQWAFYRSTNSTAGWSALGGQTYGAYYRDQDPNGSSSGSAVASSLGLAAGSIGTETDGSIVLPSSWNNVVGIKPSTDAIRLSFIVADAKQLQG